MSVTAIRVTESVTRSPSATQARCQNEKYGLRVTVLVRISLAYEYCTIAYSIGHAYDVLGRLLMYTANHGDNTHVTLFMLFGGDTAFGAKRQRSSQEGDARVRHDGAWRELHLRDQLKARFTQQRTPHRSGTSEVRSEWLTMRHRMCAKGEAAQQTLAGFLRECFHDHQPTARRTEQPPQLSEPGTRPGQVVEGVEGDAEVEAAGLERERRFAPSRPRDVRLFSADDKTVLPSCSCLKCRGTFNVGTISGMISGMISKLGGKARRRTPARAQIKHRLGTLTPVVRICSQL